MDTKQLLQDIYQNLLHMKSQAQEYEILMQNNWQSAEAELARTALRNLIQNLQRQINYCNLLLSALNRT